MLLGYIGRPGMQPGSEEREGASEELATASPSEWRTRSWKLGAKS
jgi:hypothetical protein